VDGITSRHGTLEVAKEYLSYLYSDEGQRIAGRNYYRPSNPQIAKEFSTQFPNLKLVLIDDYFGGWRKVHDYYFSDGGEFDTILTELKKK
jgi:sulfate transport system substrate-binding protein